jgi:ComF family protein
VVARPAQLGAHLLDALFPPACLTCDTPVAAQGGLCPACFGRLSFVSAPFCQCCGVPFAHAGQGQPIPHGEAWAALCPACAARHPAYQVARAPLRYDDGAKSLLLPFKHRDRTELALPLARLMARAGRDLLAGCDALVPVPLHRWRLWSRRHNQAALLARALSRLADRPMLPHTLRRTRATRPLGELGALARRTALADAFAVPPRLAPRIAGLHLLLVDDVMTSGATAEACTRALLEAGAASVAVLAAARVPDPKLEHVPA